MADETYGPLVYMKQGAAELVVASSGIVTIESGGGLDIESGGDIDVASGGHVDIADGGYLVVPVVSDTSSAALSNFGVSVINVDSSAPTTFTIDAPIPGVVKHVYIDNGISASGIAYISAGVPIMSSASSTNSFLRVDTLDSRVTLVGLGTTAWLMLSKSTGVTTTTGTT
jgi:hypothetical protein